MLTYPQNPSDQPTEVSVTVNGRVLWSMKTRQSECASITSLMIGGMSLAAYAPIILEPGQELRITVAPKK